MVFDGFKAALMQSEFSKVTSDDLREVFSLCCNWDGELRYHDWLRWLGPEYAQYFTKEHSVVHTYKEASIITRSETTLKDKDSSLAKSSTELNTVLAETAKNKLENFIRSEGISLGGVFALIDTNANDRITFTEFRSKIHMLRINIDDEEIAALFKSIDINNDKSITYAEVVDRFSNLNIQQLISKLRKFTESGKSTPQFLFDRHAKNQNGRMN
jgi:Ca2+-binding EF-hand superfamily protein